MNRFHRQCVRRVRFALPGFLWMAFHLSGCSSGPKVDFPDAVTAELPETVDFNFHVKPILSDRCFKCHGPDNNARQAGLRFDTRDGLFAPLQKEQPDEADHFAVAPGDVDESRLVQRILADNPSDRMPPPESNLTLTALEQAILIRWIEQGADWKPHWSLIPPERPKVPKIRNAAWVRNSIDAFILRRLEQRQWTPRPEADKETLIRRVSFDLTGLPPSVAEVDAFLADDTPGAYERVVDRLLASPHYGERMATDWMDVARYADSHGYQDDGLREMWPWRDWVIQAFNRNLPYDTFVTWQLAGDMLPDATREQILATGFNRNHVQSQEGGIIEEEYRTEYVADRTNTFGKAFLGLTMECARCHDHKYDPIAQEEYYRLFAFFNNVNESGQSPYSGVASPTVLLPDTDTGRDIEELRQRIAAMERTLQERKSGDDPAFRQWRTGPGGRAVSSLSPPPPIVHFPLDELNNRSVQDALHPDTQMRVVGDPDANLPVVEGRQGNALRLTGSNYLEADTLLAVFDRHQPFSIGLWVRVLSESVYGALVSRSFSAYDGRRGYALHLNGRRLYMGLYHVWPDNAVEIAATEPLPTDIWVHITATYDGSSRASGVRLFINGQHAASEVVHDNLFKSILWNNDPYYHNKPPEFSIGQRHGLHPILQDVDVDDLRIYDRRLTAMEAALLADAGGRSDAVPGKRTNIASVPEADLYDYYRSRCDTRHAAQFSELTALRAELNRLQSSVREVMVMKELPAPRQAFILNRGAYDAPGKQVTSGTPARILAYPEDLPENRLGLARWLFHNKNPLTSRVIVNRLWQMSFGSGIVATAEDFGNQGDLPSHPDLLDWLAVEFRESGWDIKSMMKLMVTSASYRQSSFADAELLQQDPANRFLSRGPSGRLTAHMMRDNALAASGLLVRAIGGPSVKPYQPPGLWEQLATRNAKKYEQDHGDKLYRRSLYTIWKRTMPPPMMISFDASERNFCEVRRQQTNTPLQALVLLNDPQFVEPCRMIAERMLKNIQNGLDERLVYGVRLLTSRRPESRTLELLRKLHAKELDHFTRHPADAEALLAVGEHPRDVSLPAQDVAALTVVANTILNFDAAIVKR